MQKIYSSASKLVLLTLVAVLALLALLAGVHDVLAGEFSEVTKVILVAFSNALSLVLGFYFAFKGDSTGQFNSQTTIQEDGSSQRNTQTTGPPFGGK